MGRVVVKERCTQHEDRTPSVAVYEDGSTYCFSCGGYTLANPSKVLSAPPKLKEEDVIKIVETINRKPKRLIRGLELPHDHLGYYVVWPGNNYYKLRYWVPPADRGKYYNPVGAVRPNFILNRGALHDTLYVVEGELNALSIAKVIDNTVVCPGSATNFKVNKVLDGLTNAYQYRNLVIVVDKDEAGIQAALLLKTNVTERISDVRIIAMERDANEILVKDGAQALKKALDLP
jgi:5S rRNA maturation endonuclease (ribonuclease M5)